MCYAIPGKITELKGKIAVVDYFGEKRNVLNEFITLQRGDYVYAQGGLIVDKIPEKDAIEILKSWKERFFELKKIDKRLAQPAKIPNARNILKILQRVNLKKELSKNELLDLLRLKDKSSLKLLYQTANNIRQKEHDNACCVHGIIEFSNYCKNNCLYCGIRKDRQIKRYRMDVDEIINVARYAVNELGFKALVLQSGEDYWYDEKKLYKIIKEIRKLNVLIFLSIGIRNKKTYQRLYEAGARAILLRFETSNRRLFQELRPKTSFDERIELIKFLKKIGYIVATGFLIELPGETDEDIINNILLTKSLNTDMYSFGPLIPAGGTPLENLKPVHVDVVLKTISISRFVDRNSKILVTSALETLEKDAKKKGLLAGANSLMINVTPSHYKKLYELYPKRPDKDKEVEKNIKETVNLLYSLGRAPTDLGV
jgi:biotin synthase